MCTQYQPLSKDDAEIRSASINVDICDTQGFLDVDAGQVELLVRRILVDEGISSATISLALVDNAAIHSINRRHLGHDWPTDVISFVLSAPEEPELAGELVISAEMALSTASELGADPLAELCLYTVHGLLHLCGYDDQTDSDARTMRDRENQALLRLGLANTFPLAERFRPASDERERTTWSG
jgi:probable rRNA maturation factor